jgi:hypothetical protein
MAAAIGNQYAAHRKRWTMAIDRALEKRSRVDQVEALDALAEKLLVLADAGDLGALKELGDRMEGKPSQMIGVGQDPNAGPVRTFHELVLVDGRTDAAP